MNGRPDQLVDKFLLNILDDHAFSAELQRLGLDGLKVLFLTAVGKKAHNFVALQNQPPENGARVES